MVDYNPQIELGRISSPIYSKSPGFWSLLTCNWVPNESQPPPHSLSAWTTATWHWTMFSGLGSSPNKTTRIRGKTRQNQQKGDYIHSLKLTAFTPLKTGQTPPKGSRIGPSNHPWNQVSQWGYNLGCGAPTQDAIVCLERHGGFLKWWVFSQIIHFNRIFHYKPSILGYPYFWKHPHV